MNILKKKNIVLSSIIFLSALTSSALLVSCGGGSSGSGAAPTETFYNVPACDEEAPKRFTRTHADVPYQLHELPDGVYSQYRSEFRIETRIKGHPSRFQIWEKVTKQQSAMSGVPSYVIQHGWDCVSAREAMKERAPFEVKSQAPRIFKKSQAAIEWIDRKMGVHGKDGSVSLYYSDQLRVIGKDAGGRDQFEVEIYKANIATFLHTLRSNWDEFYYVNNVSRQYEFHALKRLDSDTTLRVRVVYEKQKDETASNGDLFIPLPTVDEIH